AGFADRATAMQAVFGDLLPPALVHRHGKAEFGRAFWRREARAFAAGWTGSGADPALVDTARLRRAWSRDNPPLAAATLLHAAWLAAQQERGQRAARSEHAHRYGAA
ncbi:MAG: hypothetical protein M3Z27_03825, partial [Actinomycetota bacterium]|nr:hypothetical protein [Actinomycetota bacterium]